MGDVSLRPLLCVIIIMFSQHLLPFFPTFPSPWPSLGFMGKFCLEKGRHSIPRFFQLKEFRRGQDFISCVAGRMLRFCSPGMAGGFFIS